MQGSQSRSRRQRAVGGEDDDGPSSRADDSRFGSDSFTRSNRRSFASEGRKTSPSAKSGYDMRNEGSSSSRNRREADEWRPADDRYTYSPSKDGQRRGGRDDHDQRDAGSWGPARDSGSGRQWLDGHEQEYTGSNNQESRTPRYERERDSGFSRWTPKEEQSGQRGDRRQSGFDSNDQRNDSWGRGERRDSNTQEWRQDNGWASRRRSVVDDPPQHGAISDQPQLKADERSWDPIRKETQGQQRKNNSNRHGRRHKGKKQTGEKRLRDWRNDDGPLNNWTRRDGPSSPGKTNSYARNHQRRSPSRSRSRSPAESYYSRRTSPGRTPSTDGSRYRRPVPRRSRSPIDDRRLRTARQFRRYSRSPSPPLRPRTPPTPDSRGRPRRRTPSTMISTSRSRSHSPSRSRSRTPMERSRTVHRLPVATSLEDVRGFARSSAALSSNLAHKSHPAGNKNGDGNGKAKLSRAERKALKKRSTRTQDSTMPPPAIALPDYRERTSVAHRPRSPSPLDPQVKPASASRGKPAGFKPIGQQSSSLKRFFPGDDDDEDNEPPVVVHQSSTAETSTSRPQAFSSAELHRASPVEVPYDHSRSRFEDRSPADAKWSSPRLTPPRSRYSYSPSPPHESQSDNRRHTTIPAVMRNSTQTQSLPSTHQPNHVNERGLMTADMARAPRGREFERQRYSSPEMHTPMVTRPTTPKSAEELYEIVSQVGEGTFGKVYKARNTGSGKFVALKRIRMEAERDGFPVTAMREIKLLQSLRHDNIVRLYEMMVSNGSVYMVFEYMDHDLTGILSQNQFSFTDAHLKSLCRQMLAGLAYLHHKGVVHRDIKGSNILINNRGELKLGDFGLARFYQKRRKSDYTNRVITLWYRPPELLFGTTVYGPEVDMWSAGCIMLELFTKKPVFQGNDEIHQLDVIYKIIGTPTPERWPEVTSLPWYELVKPKEVVLNHFRELFQKWLSPAALDLAEQLLAYDPAKRVTALQALDAPYFTQEQPRAEAPVGLSTLEGEWHELETKRERAKKRRKTESGT